MTVGFTKWGSPHDMTFAKWLRDNGWEGKNKPVGSSVFYCVDDKVIAVVFYNNEACTCVTWVHDDLAHTLKDYEE